MSSADAGIVKSGTTTLEAALHNLPMVVVYKTSFVTYLIGRLLVRLDSIALVNIVAQRKIVEELVQYNFRPRRAALLVKEILMNNHVADEIRQKYGELEKNSRRTGRVRPGRGIDIRSRMMASGARNILLPFGAIYHGAISARNFGYDNHIFKVKKLPVPVISVGNISVGG